MHLNGDIKSLESFHQSVDETGVKERASAIAGRSIKKQSKVQAIKMAVSMIDLTTLEGKDSDGKVYALCQKAMRPLEGVDEIPHVAAICVYPNLIGIAKEALTGSGVKVASVATTRRIGKVYRACASGAPRRRWSWDAESDRRGPRPRLPARPRQPTIPPTPDARGHSGSHSPGPHRPLRCW